MTLSYSDYMGLKRFAGLDGLRAIAALMVVEQHLAHDLLSFIDGKGGVYIFFVLSGYLITTLLLREEAKYKTISIKAFYIRRTFRIFPIYYLVLGIYCFLIFLVPVADLASKREEMAAAFPLYFFYLGEFVPEKAGAGFNLAWSLGIEEKFYLVWPVLGFVGIKYMQRKWRPALILALAVVFSSLYLVYNIKNGFVGYYLLSIGCLLAVMLDNEYWYRQIRMLVNSIFGAALILLSFVVIYVLRVDYEWLAVFFPLATGLVIALAVIGNGKFTAILELSPLKFCGAVSYGVYLIHILVINGVQVLITPVYGSFTNTALIFACATLLSVLLAWLMHITIEQPLINYGRRLSGRVGKHPL